MRRHEQIDRLCDLFGRILDGRAARRVDTQTITDQSHLFHLPTWGWDYSRINVGNKDRAPEGGRLLLPVRLTWYPSHVIVADRPRTAHFVGVGLGHGIAGHVRLDPAAGPATMSDGCLRPPQTWGPTARGQRDVATRLRVMIDEGEAAYWQALELIEEKLDHALTVASTAATRDMATIQGQLIRALDDISLDEIRTRMVYGEDHTLSPAQRLVERCTRTGAFARVDPERLMLASIQRDAQAAVRKALGDPHIGSKVRRLAAQMGPVPIDDLVHEYRKVYPADRLSTRRAQAALSVVPNANASTFPFHESDVIRVTDRWAS